MREAFFIVCSEHPLFFHSPWLSYFSFNLQVGGRLQLSHRSFCGLWGKHVWCCFPRGE